jgi:hypothetical protein
LLLSPLWSLLLPRWFSSSLIVFSSPFGTNKRSVSLQNQPSSLWWTNAKRDLGRAYCAACLTL